VLIVALAIFRFGISHTYSENIARGIGRTRIRSENCASKHQSGRELRKFVPAVVKSTMPSALLARSPCFRRARLRLVVRIDAEPRVSVFLRSYQDGAIVS
jgi:hypothetical protein